MKPTKTRNLLIYRATNPVRSKQLGANLSKGLQKRLGRRSIRVREGDSVVIVRGEFKMVSGKVSKVSAQKGAVAIEGIKNEQTRGEKYDVYINTSNLMVTSLNTDDKWRRAKLKNVDPRTMPDEEPEITEEEEATAPMGTGETIEESGRSIKEMMEDLKRKETVQTEEKETESNETESNNTSDKEGQDGEGLEGDPEKSTLAGASRMDSQSVREDSDEKGAKETKEADMPEKREDNT